VDRRSQAYYQGLAYQELGQPEKAQELFRGLVQLGQNQLLQPAPARGTRVGRPFSDGSSRMLTANAHYLEGLGDLGLKDRTAARAELQQAVQISPDLLGARTALASIQ
jgi:tetratricopeptide (TPR) repeat protein